MGVGAGACPPPIWGCSGQAVHLRVLPWEMVVSITTFLKKLFISIFGCAGHSLLGAGFLWLWRAGAATALSVGFSLQWPSLFWGRGSRARGASGIVTHGTCDLAALQRVGIFPDQRSNLCPTRKFSIETLDCHCQESDSN